ncbi:eukaryotic translation initiation factor 4 gamma 1-like [Amia ocellicauda]|uniref:eukaryotic translation initiation factor 4 gamma 1-like n=1 Tax=Amia ocellicauda TaxID=2972642 RepID=UPI0034641FD7
MTWKYTPDEKENERQFLLDLQFICDRLQKLRISDVVLAKAINTPVHRLDPSLLTGMNSVPDLTPSLANLGIQPMGGHGPGSLPPQPSAEGARCYRLGERKEPRIINVSFTDDIQLNKAEKAWKPTIKQAPIVGDDPEVIKTQELFCRVNGILNKLTPQMFQPLMRQVDELTIDTEQRLQGVMALIFEKAISEPNFSATYANMCQCLLRLKVPSADKPGETVNFRTLLLNRCQKEFEVNGDEDFEKKQKLLDASLVGEERQRLRDELQEAKRKAQRRSLGNIRLIGELFKVKMLVKKTMHNCIVKLLKNHEESLECLCRLLSTIGKDLDLETAKPRMDQYFSQMELIIKERKTSPRIRFMLQDVLDLRRDNWVPRRGDQCPKTINQVHEEAELEAHSEQIKVQQQLMSKKDNRRGGPGGPRSAASETGWRATGTLKRCSALQQSSSAAPSSVFRSSSRRDGGECSNLFKRPERHERGQHEHSERREAGDKKGLDRIDLKKPKSIIGECLHLNDMKPSAVAPQRSQQGERREQRKVITLSFSHEVQLNKAEKAWKPTVKQAPTVGDDPEVIKTQELFRRVNGILNKLTPQMFQPLMRQLNELTIDTEQRLQGVMELIFEKAISEPNFCPSYANMCHCLLRFKVPTTDKPGEMVTFRTLLLNRCQKEFEMEEDGDEVFKKKQKMLDASLVKNERQRLRDELQEAKHKAQRRSLGHIKFFGELFKVKMLTEAMMHACIFKLLKNHEESLECLCRLLSTIGKDLDLETAKPRMDQYFSQMELIIKERKTSSRIRFLLQDVLDLRRDNWVPRRGDQDPKTIDQVHKEAELEVHHEQIKVQQQLMSKKDNRRDANFSESVLSRVGRARAEQARKRGTFVKALEIETPVLLWRR